MIVGGFVAICRIKCWRIGLTVGIVWLSREDFLWKYLSEIITHYSTLIFSAIDSRLSSTLVFFQFISRLIALPK
jgi:hypothetical protein